jgi:hypothetical protein
MKFVENATWTANSEYIYFNGLDETQRWWLCRIRVTGGTVEHVADLADFTSASEGWFGLARSSPRSDDT